VSDLPTDIWLPCQTDPELFFAPDGQHPGTRNYKHRVAIAKGLCADCPIVDLCREEGRARRAVGIWGGEDDVEREEAGHKPVKTRVISPCGTEAAAKRHWRKGESACQLCLDAAALAKANRDAARKLAHA